MPRDAPIRTARFSRPALQGLDVAVQLAGVLAALAGAWLAWPALVLAGTLALFVAGGPQPWRVDSSGLAIWLALSLVVAGALAWAIDPSLAVAQPPTSFGALLRVSPPTGAALLLGFLVWTALRRHDSPPAPSTVLAWLVAPWLLNLLGALAAPALLREAAQALGLPGPEALHLVLLRTLILWAVLECTLNGVGGMMDRHLLLAPRAHLLLGALALGAALAPLWLATPTHAAAGWPEWTRRIIAVPFAAIAHAALWGVVFACSGVLVDALAQRRPTWRTLHRHALRGVVSGVWFGGLSAAVLMLGVPLLASDTASHAFARAPIPCTALFMALAWPVLHAIGEAACTRAALLHALPARLRDPWTLLRGALIGAGLGYGYTLDLPQAAPLLRIASGFGLGVLAAAGITLMQALAQMLAHRRGRPEPARHYAWLALGGGVAGASLGGYADAAQLAALAQAVRTLGAVDAVAWMPALAHGLAPLWAAQGIGAWPAIASGTELVFALALTGLIAALPVAPLLIVLQGVIALRAGGADAGLRLALLAPCAGLWLAPLLAVVWAPAADPLPPALIHGVFSQVGALAIGDGNWVQALDASVRMQPELLAWIGLDHLLSCLLVLLLGAHALIHVERVMGARRVGATRQHVPSTGLRVLLVVLVLVLLHASLGPAPVAATHPEGAAELLLMLYRALFVAGGGALFVMFLRRPRQPPRGVENALLRIGNGEYELCLQANGRGHSRCDIDAPPDRTWALTAPEAGAHAPRGPFLYFRERRTGEAEAHALWSLTQEPVRYGVATVTLSAPTRLQVTRSQAGLRIHARVQVLREAPVERWDVHVRNTVPQARTLELFSTVHPALHLEGDAPQPLESLWIAAVDVLLWRPRCAASHAPWLFHTLIDAPASGWQDEHTAFAGGVQRRDPSPVFRAVDEDARHHPTQALSALATSVQLPAQGEARLGYAIGQARCATSLLHALRRVRTLDTRQVRAIHDALACPPALAVDDAPSASHWSPDGARVHVTPFAARPAQHRICDAHAQGWSLRADGWMERLQGAALHDPALPEYVLIRDLDSGAHHSPLHWPLADPAATYRAEFGPRDACFGHAHAALCSELRVWADAQAPVLHRELVLTNPEDRARRLRVFWLMPAHVVPLANPATDAQVQLWHADPGRIDFVAVTGSQPQWALYRHAALGPDADLDSPALLIRGRAEAALAVEGDPTCVAWCAELELPPQGTQRVLCVTGSAANPEQALQMARAHGPETSAHASRAGAEAATGPLRVRSTRPGIDRLVNHWLPAALHAACASRAANGSWPVDALDDLAAWRLIDAPAARSALLHHAALQARDGLLLSQQRAGARHVLCEPAAPHPPLRALRLVRAVLDEVQASDDVTVLDTPLPFIERAPTLHRSTDRVPLYQHARLALECALRRHRALGLPRAPAGAASEALDLAYALLPLLREFAELARTRGQARAAARWSTHAQRLHDALSLQPRLEWFTSPASPDAERVLRVIHADVLDARRAVELLERTQASLDSAAQDTLATASLHLARGWLHLARRAQERNDPDRAARARSRALAAWLRSWPRMEGVDAPTWTLGTPAQLALQLRIAYALFGVRLYQGRWHSHAPALTVLDRVITSFPIAS